MELTVGHVAGIVAAGFFIARLLSPNALVLIVSWCLRDKPTAATLTAASVAFQKSHWSTLLFSDSAHRHGVSKSVLWSTRLIPLLGLLLGLAAIITPIGLYSDLLPGDEEVADFVYAGDPSPFGYGTPPRSNYSWARICGGATIFEGPKPCPFSESISIVTHYPNSTVNYNYPFNISTKVPDVIIDAFSSGTNQDTTISNYFDIQWRRYTTTTSQLYDNKSRFLIPDNRNMESVVLTNKLRAVEGLVVDAIEGGIGFRNHTIPPGFAHGAQWTEDLLFVQPETVCVDTNLTLDFTITREDNSTNAVTNLVLTDRGGFATMNTTYPRPNLTDTQANPDLWGRAYKAAYLHNALTAVYFNVTNPNNGSLPAWSYMTSEVGKTFKLDEDKVSGLDGLSALSLSPEFGSYIQGVSAGGAINPWRITSKNYSIIGILCAGAGNGDFANITNILVACGQMLSVPQRVSAGSSLVMEDGSSWTQKIYTCATATKATIKAVKFNYNTTNDVDDQTLTSLTVDSVRDKDYRNRSNADVQNMPLWGVENLGNTYNMSELNLVWGLVSDEQLNNANVSTVRQRSLYLPGFFNPDSGGAFRYGNHHNMPGGDFSIGALVTAYTVAVSSTVKGTGSDTSSGADYTGRASLAMWARWQNLTSSAATASLVPNLIFTDSAASTVVGTKGARSSGQPAAAAATGPAIRVTPIYLRVRYHLPYAIPALVSAALLLAILAAAAVAALSRGGCGRLRRQLHQLSAGRIYTTFLYPGPGSMSARSREWSKMLGDKVVDLAGDYPVAAQQLLDVHMHPVMQEYSHDSKVDAEKSWMSGTFAVPSPSSEPPQDLHHYSAQSKCGSS